MVMAQVSVDVVVESFGGGATTQVLFDEDF